MSPPTLDDLVAHSGTTSRSRSASRPHRWRRPLRGAPTCLPVSNLLTPAQRPIGCLQRGNSNDRAPEE
jgi:hypothetical protein